MKTNFTFDELSKIFANVAKIDAAVNNQIEAGKAYDEKSAIFDAEFEKYGYTFRNAPKELQIIFDEKCALMDEKEKAERKAYKVIKDFAALLGIGTDYCDWYEDDVRYYISHKWYFKAGEVAARCKSLASVAARKISY